MNDTVSAATVINHSKTEQTKNKIRSWIGWVRVRDNCPRTHASRAIRWSHDKHPDLFLYYMWMNNIHESLVYNNNAIIIRNTNGKCIFFFMNSTALHKFRRLDFLYCDMWPLRVANHHSWYMAVIFCTTVRRAWWIERSVLQKHVNCNTLYGTFSFSLDLNIRYIECRMPNDMNSNDFRFFFCLIPEIR